MKSLPWKQLLQQHPIFSTVRDERRIDALLADDVSWERVYAKDEVIVRQDEIGDSLFVIGSGSAEALLEVGEGPPIHLSTMRKGEVFGEMAFFEQRSRAATVRTKEPCTVLEIRGPEFQNLVDEYPDIEFRLLLKMSERLRQTNERVLALHLKTVDEKLKLFNDRLETEQRVVEASLKAAQAVFDQTKLRTDEVINSAERSRDRLNKSGVAVGTFVTVLVGLLGVFGWTKVTEMADYSKTARLMQEDMEKLNKSAREMQENMEKRLEKFNKSAQDADALREQIITSADEVETLKTQARPLMDGLIALYRTRFDDALDRGSGVDAFEAWRRIKEAGSIGDELTYFLGQMESQVVAKAQPPLPRTDQESSVKNFVNLLQQAVVDAQKTRDKLDAYYLLLVYAYLTHQDKFDQTEGDYRSLATSQAALAALKQYSRSAPKETPRRPATQKLADRLSQEADKDVLRNLSRLSFILVGSEDLT